MIDTGPIASRSSPVLPLGRKIDGDAGAIGNAARAIGTAMKPTDGSCHSIASSVEA
jgi:hypothetical protein